NPARSGLLYCTCRSCRQRQASLREFLCCPGRVARFRKETANCRRVSRAETRQPVPARASFRTSYSFQTKFLRAPRHYFSRENGTVFINCEQVRVEMPSFILRRSVQRADRFAFAVNFQDSAGDRVGHVNKMIERDEQTEWMAEPPFAQVATVQVENLNARIFAVTHI